MFNFFRQSSFNNNQLVAIVTGKTIPLENVPDPIFAHKIMGNGIGFDPEGDVIKAPANGKMVMIANTLHAIGLKLDNGIEVLIHIGLDTVNLKGKGFKKKVSLNDYVKTGQPLISFDRCFMEENNINLITSMIIVNDKNYDLEFNDYGYVRAGKDVVITINKKQINA